MALRIAVVGSGLAGLSAAVTLAARGHRVEVFEKNPWLGGKAAQLNAQGFRFDMGPTILIMPSVFRRVFAEAGRNLEDCLDMTELDPQWRCFFDDGSVLDLQKDTAVMAARLDQWTPGMGARYREFLLKSAELHSISDRFFFWRSVGSIADVMRQSGPLNSTMLRDFLRMRLGSTVSGTIHSYIREPRVAQMLEHFVQYVGSSPEASPAILCSIGHMQTSEGIWYPRGGTRAVPEALVKLGRELGVTYRTEADVARIVVHRNHVHRDRVQRDRAQRNRVQGLALASGEQLRFDAVVSNCDSVRTYTDLIGGDTAAKFLHERTYEPACSGVVLYLGLNKRYEHLAHHDFVFSRDPQEEFHHIYDQGQPAPDPTCYLAATAGTDPSSAPEGGEALYVLVHTPYLRKGRDWKQMFPAYRQVILDKLKRTAGLTDIEDRIVFESALTPQDIHDRYRVLNGAIYGLSSHGRMSGAFKPANARSDIQGLYLAGGAAHPGPGMPMVAMSGWIAADALDTDSLDTDSRMLSNP
jgi:phytoene desaturase